MAAERYPSREAREIVKMARGMGFSYEHAGKHLKFTHPQAAGPVFASGTPTCPFAVQKVRRDLRNALRRNTQENH